MKPAHYLLAGLLLAGAATAADTVTARAPAAPTAPSDWRAMAAADLESARAAIRTSHPGYIDDQNPDFRAWEARGYEQARALLPRVNSYHSMLAAVRYYIAGFQDGHLGYSDNIRKDGLVTIAGWRLDYQDGSYRVSGIMPGWPQPLPPVGAELLSCDGVQPEQRLRHISRYFDGRDLPGVRHGLTSVFTALDMPGEELKECRFRSAQGKELVLAQHYGPVQLKDFMALRAATRGERFNAWSLQDGVLRVRTGNFQPDRAAAQQIDKMLEELPRLEGFHTVVFDSRGNGGGNSAIGERLFDAATGGLVMDESKLAGLPSSYAQWRVSDAAIRGMDMRLERIGAAQGKDSTDFKWVSDLRERLLKAKAAGQPWVEQPGSVRLSRADIVARNGKLRRFSGKVVLVTDEHCASACLDFADLVRSVPGALHMGQATSADTLYMDIGRADMPSGNHLVLPLKVWRNRLRGNNEVLQPDVALHVNIGDDAAVRRAVLAALPR